MPRISIDNYDTVASWNGSQDLFIVEQSDGTKVATPAMVKQYVLGNSIDDIYSVMGQMGAKNLLVPKWTETQTTENGVTYTFNVDGTVVMNTDASGATANTNCNLKNVQASTDNIYPAGTYKLSGCPSGGSVTTYRIWACAYRPGDSSSPLTGNLYDEGNGVTFIVNETFQLAINLTVRKNYVCNNLTWKPMLRYASDTDNTYQPYAKTNKQLTEQVATKQDTLTFDNVPTANSNNPVKSGGIYSKIGDLTQTGLTGDSVAEQLDDAKGQIANLLITDTFTTEAKNFTAGTDGYCSVSGLGKSGYTILGVIDIDANKTGFGLTTWHCTPGAVTAWIRPLVNITGLTITFKILYIKDLS